MQRNRFELEVWRDVPGYEGWYRVSDMGRVRSLDRIVYKPPQGLIRCRGKVLMPRFSTDGYLGVRLRGHEMRVQRLVLMAFRGPCPDGHVSCHKNGVRTDNRVCNLRWDTQSGNCADRNQSGEKNPMSSSWRVRRKLKTGWQEKVVDLS